MKNIVARTDHLGIVTRMGVKDDVASGRLRTVPISSPLPNRFIGLAWRDDRGLTAVLRATIQALESAATEFV